MLYYVSKAVYFVAQPSVALLLTLAAGLLLAGARPGSRLGRWMSIVGVVGLAVGGLSPLGNWIIYPLEQRFTKPDAATLTARPPAGIIILGGFEDTTVTTGRGELTVNESAERLIEGARLALRFPAARVVFSGGVAEFILAPRHAAHEIAGFLSDVGVDRARHRLESSSRTTWENALLTRDLVQPKAGETWLLVTSAYHMPRAIGVFRRAGFDVLAYPVDYRTQGALDLLRPFDGLGNGLRRLDHSVKEWVGLLAYRLAGRTEALFPAP